MGGLCSTPRPNDERLSNAPHFAARWVYKDFTFENGVGDICYVEVDAIVNASNNQLVHNNGLSNSIIAQGGEVIQEESNKIIEDNHVHVGTAVATSGGSLHTKYIIHVVTPIWTGGDNMERYKLEKCVSNALVRADELDLKSIAFPSLTSGVFGFPKEICAEIIVDKCVQYLEENASTTALKEIKFINNDANTVKIFKAHIERIINERREEESRFILKPQAMQEHDESSNKFQLTSDAHNGESRDYSERNPETELSTHTDTKVDKRYDIEDD